MGDARTRHIQAKRSRRGESEPDVTRTFPRSGLLFDARGGRRTATCARCAPCLAQPFARRAGPARPDRFRARDRGAVAADLHHQRLQPRDALALARWRGGRLDRVRVASACLAQDRGARCRPRGRRRGPLLAALLDRSLSLARPGQLGRDRDHERLEGLCAQHRRSVRVQLLPDQAGGPLVIWASSGSCWVAGRSTSTTCGSCTRSPGC